MMSFTYHEEAFWPGQLVIDDQTEPIWLAARAGTQGDQWYTVWATGPWLAGEQRLALTPSRFDQQTPALVTLAIPTIPALTAADRTEDECLAGLAPVFDAAMALIDLDGRWLDSDLSRDRRRAIQARLDFTQPFQGRWKPLEVLYAYEFRQAVEAWAAPFVPAGAPPLIISQSRPEHRLGTGQRPAAGRTEAVRGRGGGRR